MKRGSGESLQVIDVGMIILVIKAGIQPFAGDKPGCGLTQSY